MQTEKKMKVLMINGSPNEHGCTDTALKIVSGALAEDGVEKRNRLARQPRRAGLHRLRRLPEAEQPLRV